MQRLITFLALVLANAAASAADAAAHCGAFARLNAPASSGWCAAVVAGARDGLRMPRGVLWLGRTGNVTQLLVTDMGSWEPKRGRLVLLDVDIAAGTVKTSEIAGQLDRPHGLRRGPDGRIYVAEASRISRFEWPAKGAVALHSVVEDLPAKGRHPLKEFVFAPDGSMYINAGSATDDCDGKVVADEQGLPGCEETSGPKPQAVVYRAKIDFTSGRITELKVFARGLRNSTALAVHSSGMLLQGENNIDTDSDEHFPADEINKVEEGAHYGWPACVEARKPYRGMDAKLCEHTREPVLLMPAHAAPLHMEISSFGSAQHKQGLVVGWHGYRAAGQRVVRYELDASGLPHGKPTVLMGPWKAGTNKFGAPVGWAEDDTGHLWIADDRNRMLLRLGAP